MAKLLYRLLQLYRIVLLISAQSESCFEKLKFKSEEWGEKMIAIKEIEF